jgi:hypothetical protein
MPTNFPENPDHRGRKDIGDYENIHWAVPMGIFTVIMVAAVLIFSAAGPDRTRTAANNNQPPAVSAPAPGTGENVPAKAPTPSQPNPAGTQ